MDTPLNLYDDEYHTPVIVACRDANGIPQFVPVIIAADESEVEAEEHYAMAQRVARSRGYELPDGDIICMDYQDAVQTDQEQMFLQVFGENNATVGTASDRTPDFTPKVVAVFRNEEAHGSISTDDITDLVEHADAVEDVIEGHFTLWALDDALESGLPIDKDSGADMVFYGYYNTQTHDVWWF